MATSTTPLTFSASFSRDARFAPTAGELAAKLAQATGCADASSQEIRAAVQAAFAAALAADVSASIDLALRASGTSFATDVTCGTRSYLHLTHPRSA
jgi:uncharacterized glyoxalase superfamily metalloenzyme YdcJ